jgi:hypothetical protein
MCTSHGWGVILTGAHGVSNVPKKLATCLTDSLQIPSAHNGALLLVFESDYFVNSVNWSDNPVDTITIILKELAPSRRLLL